MTCNSAALADLTRHMTAATPAEDCDLKTALSLHPAHYDGWDVVRLIIYRRAVRDGFYGTDDQASGGERAPFAGISTDWTLEGFRDWLACKVAS